MESEWEQFKTFGEFRRFRRNCIRSQRRIFCALHSCSNSSEVTKVTDFLSKKVTIDLLLHFDFAYFEVLWEMLREVN